MSNISDFENVWKKFITRLKGELMEQMKRAPLTFSVADITLSNAATAWSVSYDECGRWLTAYSQSEPDKGALISDILTKDMHFTEIAPAKGFPQAAKIAIPAAGAVAGFCISHFLGAGFLVQAISTVAPAALLYPATASLSSTAESNGKTALLNDYLAQLDKYKTSVLSVIANS